MANKWMTQLIKDGGIAASELKKKESIIIPSWSPSLNWSTTIRGYRPGKINVLYGAESAGKSLLAIMAIIQQQRMDSEAIAVYFDTEFSFNSDLFIKLGGDPSRLVVRKSNKPETIFDYIAGDLLEMLQDGAPIKAIVIDSIKAIRYPKDMKKVSTDMVYAGGGSNYLPSALKMIIPVIAEYGLLTFFIQQVGMNLDPMKALRNPYTLPDGMALKHCADLMLEVSRLETKAGSIEAGETIAGGAQQVGHKVRVKVRKNRMGIPARIAQFTFNYEKGIVDTGGEIFELAKSIGVITHPINPDTGKENVQMWKFDAYPAIRGEANMKNEVINNPDLQKEIMEACHSFKDSPVEADASGFVNDDNDTEV
jgi:RecA/RadA recombinase